jgi:L,D-peptidoglycan transpeptidase YkuD (ErfK/YbiS/YcfS/YnhG family)
MLLPSDCPEGQGGFVRMRISRALTVIVSGLVLATVALMAGGIRNAEAQVVPVPTAWFASQAGSATQVLSVIGTGGSGAWLLAWEKRNGTWIALGRGTAAKVGSKGISASYREGSKITPAGIFTLPSAFGHRANPGTALPYRKVDTSDWWVSDTGSRLYNTYQRCTPGRCGFRESAGENLGRAGTAYNYAAVMGVNLKRVPGAGSAFFLHVSTGTATAGCVAIPQVNVISVLKWLKPGALIAIKAR